MRIVQVLSAFVIGFFIGLFCLSHQTISSGAPIRTDFCFLAQNRDLFRGRTFVTKANMTLDVHGELLSDQTCPGEVLSFTSSPDIDDKVGVLDSEIRKQLQSKGYAEVSVTFVGKVGMYSRVENASEWLSRIFRLKPKRKSNIVISQILSAEGVQH